MWKFNACDLVLMDPLVSLVSLIDFFGLSSVYPCCMTTFKDSSGFLKVCGGTRSESRFTTVEGEFEKSIGMAACGTTALLHYRIELEIHMLVVRFAHIEPITTYDLNDIHCIIPLDPMNCHIAQAPRMTTSHRPRR